MRRISVKKIWIVVLFIAVTVITVIILQYYPYRVGSIIGEYKGVQVFENGIFFYRSHGRHFASEGYYFGQKWQCTEFVKRFYYLAKKHKMNDVWGHARDYFDDTVPQGGLNVRRNMLQYQNGGSEPPQADDLLVFTDTKYGHVAIIFEVNGDNVMVIQQNILGRPTDTYHLMNKQGKYFIDYPRIPAGWLRVQSVQKTGIDKKL